MCCRWLFNRVGISDRHPCGILETCMRNKYLTATYAAQMILKIWAEDGEKASRSRHQTHTRQTVFITGAAALVGLPGYTAYARKLLTQYG